MANYPTAFEDQTEPRVEDPANGTSLARIILEMQQYIDRIVAKVGLTDSQVSTALTYLTTWRPRRVVTATDAATVTPNLALTDVLDITELSQTTTIANWTAVGVTLPDAWPFIIRAKSTTARTINFGNKYRARSSLALPTTTIGSGTVEYWTFLYHQSADKLDLVSAI